MGRGALCVACVACGAEVFEAVVIAMCCVVDFGRDVRASRSVDAASM